MASPVRMANMLIDIAQKHGRFTPLPLVTVRPIAGQRVTYRHMGDVYTDTVLAVGDFFEQPAYLVGKVWITGGQVIGIVSERAVA